MLDTTTKKRIDDCRDILVGKIPDPKSQVEQITIALIYKFMDDMDNQSVEMGGKPSFFTGEFEKYSWSAIFSPRTGGNELLILYSGALLKMNQNPNIPQLFRDIFKNAFLPYRDPETLRHFLKEINRFTYDHSERLGDAFEYLLSVLSSQGDAGQFRTPRHIIDFMVKLVDPQPNDLILDPACGTAGFLISAYKHIMAQNPKLTPTRKQRLLDNIVGYDISPDMVRLSLVNMYLHGFANPHIHEYDTLTSEDRWDETFDVIMANPPFMTPKGGIRPHSRFSIKAKRSEVLFVDYIAEHLNPHGRAAVIVPQGVLTDQAAPFSKLRTKLIKHCGLEAIIHLPPGCFRPYADAETAIVVFRKRRSSDSVWFFELKHDGFSQDDRRTPILRNDIPELLRLWPTRAKSRQSFSVPLAELQQLGDDLSLGVHKSDHLAIDSAALPPSWQVLRLDSIVEEVNARAGANHSYPVLSVTKHRGFVNSNEYFNKRVFSEDTSKYKIVQPGQFAYSTIHLDEGAIAYLDTSHAGVISPMYKVFRLTVSHDTLEPAFLFQLLKSPPFLEKYRHLGKGSVKRRKSVPFAKFAAIRIPVPPIAFQRRTVQHIATIQTLEAKLESARLALASEIQHTLDLVGLREP